MRAYKFKMLLVNPWLIRYTADNFNDLAQAIEWGSDGESGRKNEYIVVED